MLLILRCVCMQKANYLEDKEECLAGCVRKYVISMKGMGDWMPTAPQGPGSVSGLLHHFKQVDLHLISKLVKAIWDKKFCKSRSQNVLVHNTNTECVGTSLTMVFTSERYKQIFKSSSFKIVPWHAHNSWLQQNWKIFLKYSLESKLKTPNLLRRFLSISPEPIQLNNSTPKCLPYFCHIYFMTHNDI